MYICSNSSRPSPIHVMDKLSEIPYDMLPSCNNENASLYEMYLCQRLRIQSRKLPKRNVYRPSQDDDHPNADPQAFSYVNGTCCKHDQNRVMQV